MLRLIYFIRILSCWFWGCHTLTDKDNERRTDRKKNAKNVYDESRLGGDEDLRGTCKERIKCMSSAYVTVK